MMTCTVNDLEAVFAYMNGSPDRQTHLIHLEAFFLASLIALPSIWKVLFLTFQLWNSQAHDFGGGFRPQQPSALTQSTLGLPIRISSSCKDFSAW
jgi:hypothetical protein